jgi:hypothetical protein
LNRSILIPKGAVSDPIAVSSPSHRLSEPVADWSRRKISLCDLGVSAVKPGFEGDFTGHRFSVN